MMEQLHFLRPWWVLGLIPLCLILVFLWRSKQAKGAWRAVCDAHLIPYILEQRLPAKRLHYSLLMGFAGILAIVALAGPAWQKLPQPLFKQQSALVVMLDLSKSMDAQDVTPSRLQRARLKLLDLLRLRNEGQTALIVYAADAFVVTPLTDDTETITALVHSLSTDLMPSQGSRPDRAIEQALELLSQAGMQRGSLLLMSDGVAEDEVDRLAAMVVGSGHRLSVIAVGTKEGAPIPDTAGGFVKDSVGQIVVPKLNESGLMELAKLGEGIYSRLRVEDADIIRVLTLSDTNLLGSDTEQTELQTDQWREEGPWLLLVLLPIALLAFRRGLLLVALCIGLHWSDPVAAFEWDDLWFNPNQKGARAMTQQDYVGAAGMFRDEQWKAAAFYRAGEYDQSLAHLEHASGSDAVYNRGNALAKLGRIQEAIESYEHVLAEQPDHEDAKYNLDLLQKLQDQQQQSSQPDQQQTSSQSDDPEQDKKNNSQERPQSNQAEQSDINQDETESQNENQQSLNQNEANQGSSPEPEQQHGDQAEQADNGQQHSQKQEARQQQQDPRKQAQTELERQTHKQEQQATEQWLRRIPDDPGGLLRRKFRYQYSRRGGQVEQETQQW